MDEIFTEIKRYADLRVEEAKLKFAKGFSGIMSQMISLFLALMVLIILLALASVATMQYLNAKIGSPWGALIVCGTLLVMLVILVICRKRLLHRVFDAMFTGLFSARSRNPEEGIPTIERDIAASEAAISDKYNGIRHFAGAACAVMSFINGLKKSKSEKDKAPEDGKSPEQENKD